MHRDTINHRQELPRLHNLLFNMTKRKPTRKRMDVTRPRNGGEWTEARYTAFVKAALRGALWPPKFVCIKEAFIRNGVNPKTGKKCKLCRCAGCGAIVKQGDLKADHIIPVVGPEGFTTWDNFISRLFVEKEGFQALCGACHEAKTASEREARSGKSAQTPGNSRPKAKKISRTNPLSHKGLARKSASVCRKNAPCTKKIVARFIPRD